MSDEPELAKLARVGPRMTAAVELLTWLNERGIVLAQRVELLGTLSRVEATPDQIAALYCGIDLQRLEEERMEFLEGHPGE